MSLESVNSEQELLKRIAEGNENAFKELFMRYSDKVYSIVFDITGETAIAEDVVQDTFLKIWLKRTELPAVEHFSAWLFTITRNYVFTALKSIARRHQRELTVVEDFPLFYHDIENNLSHKEYEALLRQAIDKLPIQQRQVYQLIKEQGLKREEAASRLNISPETVKTHLAQAMRTMKAWCMANLQLLYIIYVTLKL